jgi:predicted phage terminase large subunit-like protein
MNLQLSPSAAASEITRRREARQRLLNFTTYTYPAYIPELAHELIADCLEAVLFGGIKRLMIFAPPQHGKTELVSVRFPPFWLAHRPEDPVILTSYGASLAHTKSGEARDVMESPAYQRLFPEVCTDQTSRSKESWRIAGHRGGLIAAGVGGPITGFGAALGVIDDPFENWEQAYSQTVRDRVWNWWRSTFRTRIWEDGAIILIMTRWHEDDLAGRLLQDQGEKWKVLRLPALAETQEERDENARRLGRAIGKPDPLNRFPGEPLCPLRYSKETLEDIREDTAEMAWAAEYQGVPRLGEGNRFKREWFTIAGEVPAGARFVRYWDKAGTAGGGAYSAGVLLATADDLFYVVDVVRGQWSSAQRERVIKQTAELDRQRFGQVQIWVEQEPGSGGKESAEATIRNLVGFPVFADRVTGSKDVRLEPFASPAEVGNVKLVRGPWNWDWLEEMCAVPSGRYRDQVDATAGAFNKLAQPRYGGTVGSVRVRR